MTHDTYKSARHSLRPCSSVVVSNNGAHAND